MGHCLGHSVYKCNTYDSMLKRTGMTHDAHLTDWFVTCCSFSYFSDLMWTCIVMKHER